MNQSAKTIVMVAAAAVVVVVAWLSTPPQPLRKAPEGFNEKLFSTFTDPVAVASLEFLKVNEQKTGFDRFSVAKKGGAWIIPSHNNYPADAEDQVGKAAGMLIDLSIVAVASEDKADEVYQRYGVMEPTLENFMQYGAESVGSRATMKDASGAMLADLIIGKENEENPELRYVRAADQSRVVTVKMSVDRLKTKFADWIETDVLKLGSQTDIRQIVLNDYATIVSGQSVSLAPRGLISLKYDDDKGEWNADDIRAIDAESRKMTPAPLVDDEELDKTKIQDMQTALNELKIVDVYSKPEGFRKAFSDEGGEISTEIQFSLMDKGFYLVPGDQGGVEFYSTDGEIHVSLKDGVSYTLRFGQAESVTTKETNDEGKDDATKNEDDADAEKKDDEKAEREASLNRYLLVMAQFDPSMIPEPKYEPLPEPPKATTDTTPDAEKPVEASPPAGEEAETPPAAPQGGGQDADNPAPENPDPPADKADADNKETDKATTDADSVEKEEPSDDGVPPKSEDKPADQPADKATEQPDDKSAAEKLADAQKMYEQTVERINRSNERKKKDYDDKVAAGKKRVKALNERFADWYYVIPDDVFKKIHLGRADIVKKKEKENEAVDDGSLDDGSLDSQPQDKEPLDQPPTDVPPPPAEEATGDEQPSDEAPADDAAADDKPTDTEESPAAEETP